MKVEPRLAGFIEALVEAKGTDLLVAAGSPPLMRVSQELVPVPGAPVLVPADTQAMITSLLSPRSRTELTERREVDFPFNWRGEARFRGNAFHQRDSLAVALRLLPFEIPSPEALGLPRAVMEMAARPSGLLLATGPTGSGKSTTLAAVVDMINHQRRCHILTIEDPIEYLHRNDRAVVNQREVGSDTESFARGLRSALREDPDVIMVGEVRDVESAEIALTLAQTGHLVLTTLHTNDTSQAIDRLVRIFGAYRHDQVCQEVAASLAGVVHQRLLPRIGGGLVAAFEVLQPTHAVRTLIREGHVAQLRNAIAMGRQDGMQTLESSLLELIEAGVVTMEEAAARSLNPRELSRRPMDPNGAARRGVRLGKSR